MPKDIKENLASPGSKSGKICVWANFNFRTKLIKVDNIREDYVQGN